MIVNLKKDIHNINDIALPLVLNMITSLLIGLVDQAMVGRISVFAYGAVGSISLTLYSVSGILGMIAVSFNILGSKIKGVNVDNNELLTQFKITINLSVFIGIIIYILILIFKVPILKVFFGLNGEIFNESIKYLNIYGMSVGLTLILFVFSSLFKILRKTKWILYGSLVASISNLILDYIFIFGKLGFPKMGVTGAAIASVISLFINIIIYIFALKGLDIPKLSLKLQNYKSYIKKLIKVAIPLMGQEFLEGTLFNIAIIAIVSRIGVIEIAAYSLLFNLINILLMPMYAYSSTSLNLISELSVKNEKNKMKATPILCLIMSFLFYVFISLIYINFKMKLLGFITNDLTVINFSASYVILLVFTQMFNLPHSIYKHSLQGINKEKWVFIISLIINIISVITIICLVFIFKIGFSGIYMGIGINYALLSLLFYNKYTRSINFQFDINYKKMML